jgi:hypothetical protein
VSRGGRRGRKSSDADERNVRATEASREDTSRCSAVSQRLLRREARHQRNDLSRAGGRHTIRGDLDGMAMPRRTIRSGAFACQAGNRQAKGLTAQRARRRLTITIDSRGDLPPLAATLNNELKSDSPGGAARLAFFVSISCQVVRHRSTSHTRTPMPVSTPSATTRLRAAGARGNMRGSKRMSAIESGCMCIPIRMCMGRIQGCRPGSATRPGCEERG